jgi:hypothetical protein
MAKKQPAGFVDMTPQTTDVDMSLFDVKRRDKGRQIYSSKNLGGIHAKTTKPAKGGSYANP